MDASWLGASPAPCCTSAPVRGTSSTSTTSKKSWRPSLRPVEGAARPGSRGRGRGLTCICQKVVRKRVWLLASVHFRGGAIYSPAGRDGSEQSRLLVVRLGRRAPGLPGRVLRGRAGRE